MNDQQMRELLQEIIEDVDQGRLEVAPLRPRKTAGTVLAAAAALGLGVGMAACSSPTQKKTSAPADGRPTTSQVDAAAVNPPPTPPKRKEPMARKPPMVDPGPQPEYAAPAPPPTMRPKRLKRRPMKPYGGNKPLYGVP